eukprot:SM000086S23028  [mRNA]  locus=s86:94969:95852:+ [translate_table: standard]
MNLPVDNDQQGSGSGEAAQGAPLSQIFCGRGTLTVAATRVNGASIGVLIDTGTTISTIRQSCVDKLKIPLRTADRMRIRFGNNKKRMESTTKADVSVQLDDVQGRVPVRVVPMHLFYIVLGIGWLAQQTVVCITKGGTLRFVQATATRRAQTTCRVSQEDHGDGESRVLLPVWCGEALSGQAEQRRAWCCSQHGTEALLVDKRAGCCSQHGTEAFLVDKQAGCCSQHGAEALLVDKQAGCCSNHGAETLLLGKRAGCCSQHGAETILVGKRAEC